MKIVIAGCGEVGKSVAASLSAEGHDITVIDRNPEIIASVSNELDVICVEGSAVDPETLRSADISSADLCIAATEQDAVNMICGISAKHSGAKHVIARVRDPEYLRQSDFFREALGLSYIINPEQECAREISRVLHFPTALRVETFSKGNIEMIEYKIPEGSPLHGIVLRELPRRIPARILVVVVTRDGKAVIPNGSFTLQAGDRLTLTGSTQELRRFFVSAGAYKKPVRNVLIMGGGRLTVYLVRILLSSGMSVTVLERSRERCDSLCDLVPEAEIICGDATRSDVLQENGILTADAFVALTGEDGDNIITSLYARSCHVEKVVLRVNREHFTDILEGAGLDSVVAPKHLIAQQMLRYVRAMNASGGSSIESLYRLADGRAEALEFRIEDRSACVGIPLRELRLRRNVLIASIIRGSRSILPGGDTVIRPGDHAVVISLAGSIRSVDDILEAAP